MYATMYATVRAAIADRTWSLGHLVRRSRKAIWSRVATFIVILVVFGLGVPSPHAHVAPDSHAASLLGNNPAQRRALCQARELLGTENGEGDRLDFQTPICEVLGCRTQALGWFHVLGIRAKANRLSILILGLLELLVEIEAETEFAFMSD